MRRNKAVYDLKAIRDKIQRYEAAEAERLDRITDDRAAISALTRAETCAIKRQRIIEDFVALVAEVDTWTAKDLLTQAQIGALTLASYGASTQEVQECLDRGKNTERSTA